jgi:cobalt/nickel transport system ATP-binding protein
MEKIIEIKCLEHTYSNKTTVEICGLEFTVNRGEKVAILGPNGGGKTTLIKHIIGLLKANVRGSVEVFGVDPTKEFDKIRHRIGVVMQSVDEQLIGPTVFDDVLFAPLNYNYSHEEAIKLADQALERLGIMHLKEKVIHYLSGGEKRKVALAGALVLNPELLILDEPFEALDVKSQHEFIKFINEISAERNITVVLTTHDLELVTMFADTLYLLASGNVLSRKGTPREIFLDADLLDKFNLSQPAIIALFTRMKSQGIDLGEPMTIEEAHQLLSKHFSTQTTAS